MNSGVLTLFLAVSGLGLIAGLLFWAYRRGQDSEKLEEQKGQNEARERIEDAAGMAPDSRSELLERLRKPGGKL